MSKYTTTYHVTVSSRNLVQRSMAGRALLDCVSDVSNAFPGATTTIDYAPVAPVNEPAAPPVTRDHETLLAIQAMLDGTRWSADTLDHVRTLLRKSGYQTRDADALDYDEPVAPTTPVASQSPDNFRDHKILFALQDAADMLEDVIDTHIYDPGEEPPNAPERITVARLRGVIADLEAPPATPDALPAMPTPAAPIPQHSSASPTLQALIEKLRVAAADSVRNEAAHMALVAAVRHWMVATRYVHITGDTMSRFERYTLTQATTVTALQTSERLLGISL